MHIRRLSRHHTSVENPVDNVENPRHTALYHFFTYLLLCILFCILPVKEKIMRPDMVRAHWNLYSSGGAPSGHQDRRPLITLATLTPDAPA